MRPNRLRLQLTLFHQAAATPAAAAVAAVTNAGSRLAVLVLAVFGCAFIQGCTLSRQTVDLLVALPDTPAPWMDTWGPSGYLVHWQAYPTVFGSIQVDPGVVAVALELPRATVVSILAWPVWEADGPALEPTELMRPAGVIWSGDGSTTDSSSGGLSLTYSGGPAAWVFHLAAGLGADMQAFNHERLIAEISARLPDHPWLLDADRIVRALCEHSMRVDYVREVSLTEVQLDVPDGTWYAASPYEAPLTGGLHEHSARLGLTPYYDDRGRRLVVVVDEEARVWCAISPPD